jgi:hypothetical protein
MHVLVQITKSRLENKERKWSAEKVGPRVLEKGPTILWKLKPTPPPRCLKAAAKHLHFYAADPLLFFYSSTH